MELEEIVFGMRCPPTVMYAVIQTLEKRDRPVRFFEIREQWGRFLLAKRSVDVNELQATLPRRQRSLDGAFDELDDLDADRP